MTQESLILPIGTVPIEKWQMRNYLKYLFLIAFSAVFLTTPAHSDISDKDLEDIYDEVVEDVADEKIGFEELDTEELEDFRTNPLDLNSVNRPDLMKLPIPPQVVVEIIRYRVRRGGFREVEELKDVPGMTDAIYRVIRPFLTVYTEEEKEIMKGDLRITQRLTAPFSDKQFEAPENFHYPEYMMSRLRFFYGTNMEISFSLKRDAWGQGFNWENTRRYYLVSNYLYAKGYMGFDTFVLGAFKLNFERGLALGSLAKTISAVSREKKGVEPYRSSSKNAGFYGIAVQKNLPYMTWAAFYSDKWLTAKLNPDGTAKSVPSSVSFAYNNQDKFNFVNNMDDKSCGLYVSFPLPNYEFHFIGYHEKFSPEIMPVERTDEWMEEEDFASWDETDIKYVRYKFSGARNDIFSGGVKTSQGNAKFFLDYALSIHDAYASNVDKTKEREKAKAFQFAGVYSFSYTTLLTGFQRFDADYYNYHVSGDNPVEKMFSEVTTKSKGLQLKWAGEIWREINPLKEITLKNFYKTYLQGQYPVTKKFKILCRYTIQNEDEKMKMYDTSDYYQIPKEMDQARLQLTWSPTSDVRIKWQYDTKKMIEDNHWMWVDSASSAELKYRFSKSFQVVSKVKYDKGPGAGKNKYTLISISPKMKFSKNSSVSMK
ncbi:helix-hairpin-helix domain-containing protein, partial [bacterium]|nr:helix-hairpin-helix domain-containing protein [bacterium]